MASENDIAKNSTPNRINQPAEIKNTTTRKRTELIWFFEITVPKPHFRANVANRLNKKILELMIHFQFIIDTEIQRLSFL